MNYQEQLKALVGQVVAVDDQTMAVPRVFIGPLVDEGDDFYSVVDQDDGAPTSFGFHEVASVNGSGITLESAEGQNEESPDYDDTQLDEGGGFDEFGVHPTNRSYD